MNFKKIGKTIGKIAPLLGTALGGPGGAVVGSMVSAALGVDDNPSAIAKALSTDPQAAVKLQELQNKNEEKLHEIALGKLQAELSDKASARENHKHSLMPAIICVALTFMVAIGAYLLFTITIPAGNKEISYLLFGSLLTKWGDSIAYWVGTTRSSAEKDKRTNTFSKEL